MVDEGFTSELLVSLTGDSLSTNGEATDSPRLLTISRYRTISEIEISSCIKRLSLSAGSSILDAIAISD